jgi:hypothetical protein
MNRNQVRTTKKMASTSIHNMAWRLPTFEESQVPKGRPRKPEPSRIIPEMPPKVAACSLLPSKI